MEIKLAPREKVLQKVVHQVILEETLLEIRRAFLKASVEFLVLKGMALAYLVYADPSEREMGDIDLLIRPGDVKSAREILASLGYRPVGHYGTYEEELTHFGGELAFRRDRTPLVELHWTLEQYERLKGLIRIDEEALWKRAISYSIEGETFKALSLEDQLLTLSIHLGIVHRMKGEKWLFDIDRLVRTFGPQIDWPSLMERAKQWGVRRLLCHVLWASQETFRTPLPAGLKVAAVRETQGFLGQWLFLDRWPDRFRMAKRIFFPSSDWVRFRYRLQKGVPVFPYRLFHPIRLLFGKIP